LLLLLLLLCAQHPAWLISGFLRTPPDQVCLCNVRALMLLQLLLVMLLLALCMVLSINGAGWLAAKNPSISAAHAAPCHFLLGIASDGGQHASSSCHGWHLAADLGLMIRSPGARALLHPTQHNLCCLRNDSALISCAACGTLLLLLGLQLPHKLGQLRIGQLLKVPGVLACTV
jgi:hypothetical protein